MLLDLLLSLSPMTWAVGSIACFLAYWHLRPALRGGSEPNLPPSPGIKIPIIGHGYLLKRNPLAIFRKWRKQYGDVVYLEVGSRRLVVVNGYENLRHVLMKQGDFTSDKPPLGPLTHVTGADNVGVLRSWGANWKEQRTTSLGILRDFGMGKNVLAPKIAEEVDRYVSRLTEMTGRATDLKVLTNTCVSNIICSILFGQRYQLDDPEFQDLMTTVNKVISGITQTGLVNFLPWLRWLPFDPFRTKVLGDNVRQLQKHTFDIVNKRLNEYTGDTKESFSAAYKKAMDDKREQGISTHLSDLNLQHISFHLFAAGTETTATTIMWFVLLMLYHPGVQDKLYREVAEVVGTSRLPELSDKPKLKYLNATIMETQRFANILPVSLVHYTNAPVEVQGYRIPPRTVIVPVLDSVLKDKATWGDPDTFRPERFLDARGNVVRREELVPFSIGRRVCLGEALAKMELFLFISAMVQRFKFLPEDPNSLPSLESVFGTTCGPQPYRVKWEQRQS